MPDRRRERHRRFCTGFLNQGVNPLVRAAGGRPALVRIPDFMLDVAALPKSAKRGSGGLFDHVVGAGKERLGNIQTERLGRL